MLLLFIFFSALFFGSVQPNGGHVQLVVGTYDDWNDLAAKTAQGYEIVSVVKTGEKSFNKFPEFLWTLVKKNNDNDKKKNNQIATILQKIDEQQKTIDTLVEQIKTLDAKFGHS
ncbi:hypothetical protein niasHT_022192 [Heterodera trifolii]|uniref:Uncharacterized protein n=1 Tax=Heterodera trifolii TaxID=157864 RepID=A0ABD2JVM9_9BILA